MARGFGGLRVVAFESRRSSEILVAAMREVPLSEAKELLSFAEHLLAGRVDIVEIPA